MIQTEIFAAAQALQPKLINYRRTLHKNPETGFALKNTTDLVMTTLTDLG